MKYCPECLQEYEDGAKVCPDCDNKALVSAEEIARRPEFRRLRGEEDTTTFVQVGTAEDPFEADAFTSAVDESGIPVLAAMRHGISTDMLTSGMLPQRIWWEIRVPEGQREKARAIIEARREEIRREEPEAERAAEEEALETEKA